MNQISCFSIFAYQSFRYLTGEIFSNLLTVLESLCYELATSKHSNQMGVGVTSKLSCTVEPNKNKIGLISEFRKTFTSFLQ